MSGACCPGPTVLVGSKDAGPLTRLMRRHCPRQSGYLESSSACAPKALTSIAAAAIDPIEARRSMTVPIVSEPSAAILAHLAAGGHGRISLGGRAGAVSSGRDRRAGHGRYAFLGDAPARQHMGAGIIDGIDGDQLAAAAILHRKPRCGAVADHFGAVIAVREAG